MKITFLGTGTSTGIPVLGCGCEVCRSTDTRDHRLRTSALITTDTHRHILIDAGPDLRTQLLTHHNAPIDGVLVTHSLTYIADKTSTMTSTGCCPTASITNIIPTYPH